MQHDAPDETVAWVYCAITVASLVGIAYLTIQHFW